MIVLIGRGAECCERGRGPSKQVVSWPPGRVGARRRGRGNLRAGEVEAHQKTRSWPVAVHMRRTRHQTREDGREVETLSSSWSPAGHIRAPIAFPRIHKPSLKPSLPPRHRCTKSETHHTSPSPRNLPRGHAIQNGMPSAPSALISLHEISPNAPDELHVALHDRHASRVERAQIRVLEQVHEVSARSDAASGLRFREPGELSRRAGRVVTGKRKRKR